MYQRLRLAQYAPIIDAFFLYMDFSVFDLRWQFITLHGNIPNNSSSLSRVVNFIPSVVALNLKHRHPMDNTIDISHCYHGSHVLDMSTTATQTFIDPLCATLIQGNRRPSLFLLMQPHLPHNSHLFAIPFEILVIDRESKTCVKNGSC
jgi:hypothetical protein